MVTMKEIAELAGVSRGTVDRVLNKRGRVNEKTAIHVREIAQSLNYVPNRAAKSLATIKSETKIGFIIFPPTSNTFFDPIVNSMNRRAAEYQQYGIKLISKFNDTHDTDIQNTLLDELISEGADGIVICGYNTDKTRKKLQSISRSGIPVITVNSDIPDSGRLAYVGSDYYKCGRTAGRLTELITNGRANIGIIIGSAEISCHRSRVSGFCDYLSANCPNINIQAVSESSDDDFNCYAIARDYLSRTDKPIDTIYVASAGTYGVCRAVEAVPPEQRPRIICHDLIPTTKEMLNKGIISATICQQPEYQGSKPLELLFNTLIMDSLPSHDMYYTNIEIMVKESF